MTFENSKPPQQPGMEQQQQHPHVYVSQVVTEKEFLTRSNQLQEAVQSQGFVSYCQKKMDMALADFERNVWAFLKVTGCQPCRSSPGTGRARRWFPLHIELEEEVLGTKSCRL